MLPLTSCGSDKPAEGNAGESKPVAAVKAPANGDWSTVATATTAGGWMMGNPEAPVKLIEIGALTCPHCREFDETGVQPLIDGYVKTGKISWEFRPYLLSGPDIPANLIAGCNGAQSFFPLMRALYKDQAVWIGKLQSAPQEELNQLQSLPPEQQIAAFARLTGLQDWAAMRGVSQAKSSQCLADQQRVTQLSQISNDVQNSFPDFPGTPSFVLNGKLLERTGTWKDLEPKLKEAIGG
ncbi:thioredoxin domain-containing protein [Sphingomonas piscis]|uniref:Thioredoxin domain-containing protein n=2 Tax=Sphingomonas piscis TaxID=2714943 RepID=A0A6G7YNU2_9SPHN|nr:thioredoxin domain-containing protein [Sphingomonas piscis]